MVLKKKINKKNYRQANNQVLKNGLGTTVPLLSDWSIRLLYFISMKGWWYTANTELLGTRCLGIILHKLGYVLQINANI